MNKRNVMIRVLVIVAVLMVSVLAAVTTARAGIGPVTNTSVNTSASGIYGPVTLFSKVITQTTRGPAPAWIPSASYDRLDLEYIVKNSNAASQTVVLTLQHSNDGSNWVSNATCVYTATAASTTDGKQCQNFMYDTAIYAELATADPVTITVVGLYK